MGLITGLLVCHNHDECVYIDFLLQIGNRRWDDLKMRPLIISYVPVSVELAL